MQDGYVFRAVWTDGVRDMIDASQSKRPSLADREEFRLLAKGMSELGAYAMFFTDQTQGFDETVKLICDGSQIVQCRLQVAEGLKETQPTLRQYEVFGTGVVVNWKGKLGVIVGSTPVVDRQSKWSTEMGERFVQFRPTSPDATRVALKAAINAGRDQGIPLL